jgi:hypothetical protein
VAHTQYTNVCTPDTDAPLLTPCQRQMQNWMLVSTSTSWTRIGFLNANFQLLQRSTTIKQYNMQFSLAVTHPRTNLVHKMCSAHHHGLDFWHAIPKQFTYLDYVQYPVLALQILVHGDMDWTSLTQDTKAVYRPWEGLGYEQYPVLTLQTLVHERERR